MNGMVSTNYHSWGLWVKVYGYEIKFLPKLLRNYHILGTQAMLGLVTYGTSL